MRVKLDIFSMIFGWVDSNIQEMGRLVVIMKLCDRESFSLVAQLVGRIYVVI